VSLQIRYLFFKIPVAELNIYSLKQGKQLMSGFFGVHAVTRYPSTSIHKKALVFATLAALSPGVALAGLVTEGVPVMPPAIHKQSSVAASTTAATPASTANATTPQQAGLSNEPLVLPPSPSQIFEMALHKASPLSPKDAGIAANQLSSVQRSEIASIPVPKMHSIQIPVKFTPGSAIPVIHTAYGYASSLMFTGEGGDPWPITYMMVGNNNWFKVQQAAQVQKGAPSNVISVAPLSRGASSTLTVTLKGAPSPITIELMTSVHNCDANVSLRADRPGPNAQLPILSPAIPETVSKVEYGMLQGIPPKSAKTMVTNNPNVTVWSYEGKWYVRSRYQLDSPAYIGGHKDADGTGLYVIAPMPLLIFYIDGHHQYVRVSAPKNVGMPDSAQIMSAVKSAQ
jgi:intracellular multiplication protein IcmK